MSVHRLVLQPGDPDYAEPVWASTSRFRRYIEFGDLSIRDWACVMGQLSLVDLHPYLKVRWKGGLILVPKNSSLEKLVLLPEQVISFAMTRKNPEHEQALVLALRVIGSEMRRLEYTQKLKPHSLCTIRCDDCGLHLNHRSTRDSHTRWAPMDGSACSPWKGVKYNVTYA